MGQKFLFVLIGCIFVAIAGATFVNNKYINWPIHESPIIPDISAIDSNFDPPEDYIEPESSNPSIDKSFID